MIDLAVKHLQFIFWKVVSNLVNPILLLKQPLHSALEWIFLSRARDYYSIKGDPVEVQKKHVLKSSTLGRSNKIFQSSFGVVLQPIFPVTKKRCSLNKKWSFCEKNHFLFSGQVKKMSLSQIAKNGPKTKLWPKSGIFLTWSVNKKWFLCEKNDFWFSW